MSTIENVHTKDKYYVMLLEDGLVTVPKQWLTDNKKYTFWPSNVNQEQRINLIKSCAEVNEGWDKYKIQIIYGVAANYKRAREKEKLAEKISDVNTTSDEEENKRKRKIRSKKMFTESDTESDDAPVVAKLPRPKKSKSVPLQSSCPKLPSLPGPSVSSVTRMDHIEKSISDSDIENELNLNNTNDSTILKNTSDNFCRQNVSHDISKGTTDEKNFQKFVIKSLVDLKNEMKKCQGLIKQKQNNSPVQLENLEVYGTEIDILDEKFPMKSLDDVRDIEQELKHDETFKKQVKSALYLRSQNTMKKTVTRFMKILFTDEVGSKFSWTGQKENKQKFETLLLWKIIFGVVRSRFKDVSEGDVSAPLKVWLAHAQDRIKKRPE